MTDKHWLRTMPCHDFNCRLVYLTPTGVPRTAHYKTRAILADIALEVAERMLKRDKRRRVGRVVFGEAFQQ